MNYLRVSGLTSVLFLGVIAGAYAQKEGEGKQEAQPHAAPAQPHAAPAQPHAAPAQQHAAQPNQAQPAKAPARQAQQAKAPAQQPQPRVQEPKGSALAPEQHGPQQQRPQQTQQHSVASQQQPARSPQQAQSWQQKRGWADQKGSWQPHNTFQQGRDQNWAADHRTWAQRGGYGGSYIPQATFGLYFGSTHFFHIGAMPVMYMGYPRFAYDGFSFLLVDPWPGSWQENWYAGDDVYIDFNDGYYLHDRRYPGVSLALTVAL